MTTTPRTVDFNDATATRDAPREVSPAVRHGVLQRLNNDRNAFILTIATLLVLYGLLQNRYWVPSGDSEVYISIARNLARGDGYTFNGQPVAMVPPGWPLLMAGLMKITAYFLPLKLLAMTCMIGSLACAYFVARRFLVPIHAAGIVLLAGVISYIYCATFWLIAESSFCLASAGALLVAMQIREGRANTWRIALLLLLCASAVTIRWAGILSCFLVVAALLDGQIKPALDRRWIAAALTVVVGFAMFFGIREALWVTPEQAAAAREFGGAAEDVAQSVLESADTAVAGGYSLITSSTKSRVFDERLLGWGRWFSFLFWQPFRASAGSKALSLLANGIGWIIIVLLLINAVIAIWKLQWLWPAIVVYSGALAMNWPQPNARYLAPIAFLILLGVLLGARHVDAIVPLLRRPMRWAVVCFVASIALCNLALWAVEVRVARSSDFYATYEAGLNQNLIASARFLNTLDLDDREIAVSPRYTNLYRTRPSPFGLRATTMLTGKEVISVPWRLSGPPTPRTFRWLRNQNVRYYLYQPPVSPWRVWHFRMGWWEYHRTGVKPDADESGWRLYRVNLEEEKLSLIPVPPSTGWPTKVPGLEESP